MAMNIYGADNAMDSVLVNEIYSGTVVIDGEKSTSGTDADGNTTASANIYILDSIGTAANVFINGNNTGFLIVLLLRLYLVLMLVLVLVLSSDFLFYV